MPTLPDKFTLPTLPHVHQPEAPWTQSFGVFMKALWYWHSWSNHWPLVTFNLQPLSSPWNWKIQPFNCVICFPDNYMCFWINGLEIEHHSNLVRPEWQTPVGVPAFPFMTLWPGIRMQGTWKVGTISLSRMKAAQGTLQLRPWATWGKTDHALAHESPGDVFRMQIPTQQVWDLAWDSAFPTNSWWCRSWCTDHTRDLDNLAWELLGPLLWCSTDILVLSLSLCFSMYL